MAGHPAPHPTEISIHALREEGDNRSPAYKKGSCRISIHALREEGDRAAPQGLGLALRFLSTPSARRATQYNEAAASYFVFLSTPSARRATTVDSVHFCDSKFLSTPSARRATSRIGTLLGGETFLSTPSARRATLDARAQDPEARISIHALREEGDRTT